MLGLKLNLASKREPWIAVFRLKLSVDLASIFRTWQTLDNRKYQLINQNITKLYPFISKHIVVQQKKIIKLTCWMVIIPFDIANPHYFWMRVYNGLLKALPWFIAVHFNTLRPRQNGCHFPDDIFKCIFLNESIWISIGISLKFVPKAPINNIPVLVQIMAWRRPGDKPFSEAMLVCLLTHICVTRPQWFNKQQLYGTHNYTHIHTCTENVPATDSYKMHGCDVCECFFTVCMDLITYIRKLHSYFLQTPLWKFSFVLHLALIDVVFYARARYFQHQKHKQYCCIQSCKALNLKSKSHYVGIDKSWSDNPVIIRELRQHFQMMSWQPRACVMRL